jgi:hypothetical protein
MLFDKIIEKLLSLLKYLYKAIENFIEEEIKRYNPGSIEKPRLTILNVGLGVTMFIVFCYLFFYYYIS